MNKTDTEKAYRAYLGRLISDPQSDVTAVLPFDEWITQSAEHEPRLDGSSFLISPSLDFKEIGTGYFRWLRKFVEPLCKVHGIDDLDAMPTRITLPSFGAHNASEQLLVSILEEAGWTVDEVPALAEPLANSIGLFSEGRNAVWNPKPWICNPHYGRMFQSSDILNAARRAVLDGNTKRIFWTMVIDLGGYTLDFAMIGFDVCELEEPLDGAVDGKKRLATFSEPIGVQNLDDRIKRLLNTKKQEVFSSYLVDPDQRRLESFHRAIYQETKPYQARDGVVFGEGDEGAQIRDELQAFAFELAEKGKEFMEVEQYNRIDALVLTGGGCNIPIVRDTLCDQLLQEGTAAYVPEIQSKELPFNCKVVGRELARSATAIGGASVFFDKI